MVPGGQGEVQVQVARYYRSWGAAGPTVQKCKRFGSNDDASPRIAAGEEGRGGGVIQQGSTILLQYSRLDFNSSQHGLGISESEFIIYDYGTVPAVTYLYL